jgi:hypothetical protein
MITGGNNDIPLIIRSVLRRLVKWIVCQIVSRLPDTIYDNLMITHQDLPTACLLLEVRYKVARALCLLKVVTTHLLKQWNRRLSTHAYDA